MRPVRNPMSDKKAVMNILQILPELNLGGVETGTVDLAVSLVKSGHKAVVVSCGGELVPELTRAGVKHYSLDVHKKSPFAIFKNINQLLNIIKKEKIDIVHARSRAPAWAAFFSARKAGVPFITTCHGYYSSHPFSYVMAWGKLVIVPSQIIGRHQMQDFGVPFSRIRHIPRSVDMNRFKFKGPDKKSRSELIVVFGEDLAALLGLGFALLAIVLAVMTGDPRYDSAGSMAIGVLLVVVAVFIGIEIQALLIGQGVEPALKEEMVAFLERRGEVEGVYNLLTYQLGRDVMVAVKAKMAAVETPGELIRAVNRCEEAMKGRYPQITWLFFEPDSAD